MTVMDFNTAGPQKNFDVIPAGTIASLHMTVKPGGAGEGGWLRRSKAGDSEALDCRLTVVDGEFAKRVFFTLFTVAGTTEGQAVAADISRRRLRAMLESARNIRPDDESDAAKQARRAESWGDLDGLRFVGRIGIEPAKENFKAKNILTEVITPDRKEWHAVEQVPKQANAATSPQQAAAGTAAAAAAAAPAITRPAWAR
jgi:hypothetical protein